VTEYILEPTTAVVLAVVVRPAENVAVYALGIRRIITPDPPDPPPLMVLFPPPVLTVPFTGAT
jgi:hypothetical protein